MDNVKKALDALFLNGLLDPESVVSYAENVDSPLHSYFEWDDSEAARKWRLDQARSLIRSVKIYVNSDIPISVRAYVSLPSDQVNGGGYRKIDDVLNNDFMLKQFIEDINNKIYQWQKRADAIGIIIDFDSIHEQIKNIR